MYTSKQYVHIPLKNRESLFLLYFQKVDTPIKKFNSKQMEESEIKIVLLGKSDVGKTCIVGYFIRGRFMESASPTLGASYAAKTLDIDNSKVALQIWDTAGQERFRVLAPMYYRGSQAAILVFSITDEETFREIDYWSSSLKENTGPNVLVFLVGNKSDLENQRKVSEEEALKKAEEIGACYFETSALTGSGIEDLFLVVAKKCLEKSLPTVNTATSQPTYTPPKPVPINMATAPGGKKRKKECC
ncbi:Ras-related protein Rab-5A [Tritrichomonas foetus]|uniref:Ras-related protein Rab-5A n=1 Tax=Tritrichomonas foetus TaxID=1144522 RepID=A0A1J4KI91_9EUKA|nr:Ras-related protein Rab-5A [Tritrichomonas foetus]|eukprot:OHT10939.1 Ras-related protein Rab-5A [Tritrichomonas foetus]